MFHPLPNSPQQFAITLSELLASRDACQARQQTWLQSHQVTLISFTVVIPGPVKDNQRVRDIFNQGLCALKQVVSERQWVIIAQQSLALTSGPECLVAVDAPAKEVKQRMIEAEQQFAVGRLWDFDVFTAQGQLLSRQQLGVTERRCLVCDQPAKVCARQRTHSLSEILNQIEVLANASINH